MTSSIFDLVAYFPQRLRLLINDILHTQGIEEIRVRINRPLQAIYDTHDELYSKYIAARVDCEYLCETFCDHSVYSCEDDMKNGFITLQSSGVRVGISGDVIASSGKILRFRNVTGFCIRIPHEHINCSKKLCEAVNGLSYASMLIASPPGIGKTTLLRDMARELSDEYKKKVCIVDERSEIAGASEGEATFNIGMRTDVLDNCPKAEGMLMALRTLSPDVLITDEIGKAEDFSSVRRAMHSGVNVAASIHSNGLCDIKNSASELLKEVRYTVTLYVKEKKRYCELYDRGIKKDEFLLGGIK